MIKTLGAIFSTTHLLYVALIAMLVVIGVYLYRQNEDKRNHVDLIDLVAVNGRLNERKFSRFGAWVVSTWGFIYLISQNTLSEWYFIGYMGAWVANALIGKAIKDPNNEETNKKPDE